MGAPVRSHHITTVAQNLDLFEVLLFICDITAHIRET